MPKRLDKNVDYPLNLVADILDVMPDELPDKQLLPQDLEGSVEYVLYTLPSRMRGMIKLRYDDRLIYREIANLHNVSVSRVGQIIHRGIRWMRHPARCKYIRQGVKGVAEAEARECAEAAAAKAAKETEELMFRYKDAINSQTPIKDRQLSIPLDEMSLSTRTYNALARSRTCRNAKDILELGCNRLMRIRTFGPKSLFELTSWFESRGIPCESLYK